MTDAEVLAVLDGPRARFVYAEEELAVARLDLHEKIRFVLASRVSAYRVAQITGISERHVGRIRAGA